MILGMRGFSPLIEHAIGQHGGNLLPYTLIIKHLPDGGLYLLQQVDALVEDHQYIALGEIDALEQAIQRRVTGPRQGYTVKFGDDTRRAINSGSRFDTMHMLHHWPQFTAHLHQSLMYHIPIVQAAVVAIGKPAPDFCKFVR